MQTINTASVSTILVNTTNGADIPAGFVLISANQRETEAKKVTAETRYRNILIPELVVSVEGQYQAVLLDKLYSLAREQFAEQMEESNRMLTTVLRSSYTVAGLLAYYATDAKSGRMTKESVIAWFNASTTCLFIQGRKPAAVEGYRTNYAKLASPNHGLNPQTCTAMLAVLQEDDLAHPVTQALASKLRSTIEKSQQSLVDIL